MIRATQVTKELQDLNTKKHNFVYDVFFAKTMAF